jgi:hypothetical protein
MIFLLKGELMVFGQDGAAKIYRAGDQIGANEFLCSLTWNCNLIGRYKVIYFVFVL